MSKIELKPCPFCGGEAVFYYFKKVRDDFEGGVIKEADFVQCEKPDGISCKCGAGIKSTRWHGESEKSLASKWNNRKEAAND